jgi:hypothetical protein
MKLTKWRFLILAALMAIVLAAPVWAFELKMEGNYNWSYEIRSQGGSAGFFGRFDQDAGSGKAGTGVGFMAPVNFWVGNLYTSARDESHPVSPDRAYLGLVSGSDAATNTMYMDTNVELKITEAIRVRGLYHIGEWLYSRNWGTVNPWPGVMIDAQGRNLSPVPNGMSADETLNANYGVGYLNGSQYLNNRYPGITRSFSPGYWNTLWLTAEFPIGILTIGKRPSSFGMGLFWNGAENRSSESCSLFANYGPLRLGFGFYPARRGFTTIPYIDGIDGFAYGGDSNGYPRTAFAPNYYYLDVDKNGLRSYDMGPTVTYRSGAVDIGVIANWMTRHNGGEGVIDTPANRSTVAQYIYGDFNEFYGGAYFKFNNGKFIFNSEVDWYQSALYRIGFAPQYRESWRGAVEGQFLTGPSKISVIYAMATGPDRRRAGQIDRTGMTVDAGIRSNTSSNTGVFKPYAYLMVYGYGLGTHINLDTGNGTLEDANILATRFDYAIASNLNVFGTFAYAKRNSRSGYGWGTIKPDLTPAGAPVFWNTVRGGTPAIRGAGYDGRRWAPSIPDDSLGWEIDAGADWQLLENLLLSFNFQYWQPGEWFKYACVDKNVPLWFTAGNFGAVQAANIPAAWGINPDRGIDPVWGLNITVNASF